MPLMLPRYIYPEINIPFNGKLHPDMDEMNEEVRKWTVQFKLYSNDQQYKKEQVVRLISQCYPDGEYARVVLTAKYHIQLFLMDDSIEAGKQSPYWNELMNNELNNPHLLKKLDQAILYAENPIVAAFADIWSQLKKLTDIEWQNRFAENLVCYLKAVAWEVNNINCNRVPPLTEYLEYRHYTSAVLLSFNLVEMSQNIFLPDSILANPTMQRLCHIAVDVVALENDVQSFEKERKVGRLNNLVGIIKQERGISYQEAIEMASKIVNEEVKKFVALEPFLPSFGVEMDKVVNIYVAGFRDWMRGNHDWGLSSGRYPHFAYPTDQI